MGLSPRNPPPAEIRFSEFRSLIEHSGWRPLPPAPGDDRQGPDVRERIGKNGVVFSAYPIPRGPGAFGRVDLEPLPQWAESTGLNCEVSVEELGSELGFADDAQPSFRSLDDRLDDVKSFLESDAFARTRLRERIARLGDSYEVHRSTLRGFRAEIGFVRVVRAVLYSYVMERGFRQRYRRALKSIDSRSSSRAN